jgi:murein DD-endopeptidase MepM/ murein hydrolase activator NlpD
MRHRNFNLLIVHGDGSRIVRLHFPRWLLWTGLLTLALGVSTFGAIVGDYLSLKRDWSQVARLRYQITEQTALINAFYQRTGELRKEIASWRELHAKIWEPFGPEENVSQRRGKGIGGGQAPESLMAGKPTSLSQEFELFEATVAEEGQSLRALERLISRSRKVLASLPSRWPVRGSVNSEFGRRLSPWAGTPEFHGGLDIAADRGTAVKAPADGTVSVASFNPEFGNFIVIDHGQEIKTLFGHLSKLLVTQGQAVTRGQMIAQSGNTGRSSGPHLHYEIQVKGQPVDPRGYLWN